VKRLLFCVLFCAVSCHRDIGGGAKIDSKLAPYIPAATEQLAGVDVAGLVTSSLYKRHAAELPPAKNITNIAIAFNNGKPLILLDGSFNQAELKSYFSGLVFPKPGIAIAGQAPANGGGVPRNLQPELRQVPAADQIWFASSHGLPLDRIPVRSDMRSALANISNNVVSLNGGLGLDEGAHLKLNLACDSETGAKRVRDALRGMIGLGRLMTRDDERDMLPVYDAFQVDQDGAAVHLHADFNAQESDRLFKLAQGRMGWTFER
jgi:hypothetical protein